MNKDLENYLVASLLADLADDRSLEEVDWDWDPINKCSIARTFNRRLSPAQQRNSCGLTQPPPGPCRRRIRETTNV